ncbi:arginine deiminase-related protein [Nocardioides hungaricus]
MNTQAPRDVVMVRPTRFVPNPATIADNLFQPREAIAPTPEIAQRAYDEVARMATQLESAGVTVHLFDDLDGDRPDSVFPNNWFSTHPDGRVALYPMYSPTRRSERRPDILASLRSRFRVNAVYDYSVLEDDDLFLEGTGSMVLDHLHRIAYIARSFRSHDRAVEMVCRDLGYRPVLFSTQDVRGEPIYHTNVMMSVGTEVATVAVDSIGDPVERATVLSSLAESGREVVALDRTQLDEFAGNTIELTGDEGRLLVISSRAAAALTADQQRRLERYVTLMPIDVPTVELAGGSVRCMIATIHLPARVPPVAEAQAGLLRAELPAAEGAPC